MSRRTAIRGTLRVGAGLTGAGLTGGLAAGLAGVGAAPLAPPGAAAQAPGAEPALGAPDRRLAGRVALVTGAARGIGRASAVALARAGADVLAFDLCEPEHYRARGSLGYATAGPSDLEETARQVRAFGRRCVAVRGDVRDSAQARAAADRAVAELGGLDVLHANAGILPRVPFTAVTDALWADCLATNLTGHANFARAAVPHLIARGRGGRLVFTASTHAFQGAFERHVYTASKWGVVGLAKSLALELAEHRITCNCVAPGFTRTGMNENPEVYRQMAGVPRGAPAPTRAAATAAMLAANRREHLLPVVWVEPEDVAAAVVYLASDDARHVTGATVDVAAGINAHYSA